MTKEIVDVVEINKAKDFAERVGMTFTEAEISLGLLSWLSDGINLSLWHQIYASLGAAAVATIKTLWAQRKNPSGNGSVVHVIETAK
jgi:hypothetical protein